MQLTVDGLAVTVLRKSIRNMHLRVLPPAGDIVITAPKTLPSAAIERFVREKRGWIERQRLKIAARPAVTNPEYCDGQTVWLWGKAVTLRLKSVPRGRKAVLQGDVLTLFVLQTDDASAREAAVLAFYREQLKDAVEKRLPVWEARTELSASGVQIRNMKSRWGTCNVKTRSILLNLQLAKQPPVCLDYVLVHELTHLRHPDHSSAFWDDVFRVFPDWKQVRRQLNEKTFL